MNLGHIGSLRGSYDGMDAGGRATQEAKAEYRLRMSDNITTSEGRGPTLFMLTKGQKVEMIA